MNQNENMQDMKMASCIPVFATWHKNTLKCCEVI